MLAIAIRTQDNDVGYSNVRLARSRPKARVSCLKTMSDDEWC